MLRWYLHVFIHKFWVSLYIIQFCFKLIIRAFRHDMSKFGFTEAKAFSKNLSQLSSVTYGGDDYKEILKNLEPTLNHHYKRNRHHPEHHYTGILDMDLYDIVEMLCDWKASIKKHKDGDLRRSLELNKKRFLITYQLYNILKNTIKRKDFYKK